MSYPSVDLLQKVLTQKVFHYAKDSKKAAGRALGTLVEIITFYALIQKRDGSFRFDDYYKLIAEIIASNNPELLSRFIMTVGVVSNHGNWFTTENHNKELKVLALVPVATNTGHWKNYVFGKATGVCFLYDTRLKFLVNGKNGGKGAPMSCAMIYWGNDFEKFLSRFGKFGAVVDLRALQGKRFGECSENGQMDLIAADEEVSNCPVSDNKNAKDFKAFLKASPFEFLN